MPIDKKEILSLPPEERVSLAEELWSSVEDELGISPDDIAFAEERQKMHNESPEEGFSLAQFKSTFAEKYGL